MYYVYILYSVKLGKKYIGSTSNLRVRYKELNSGKSRFTTRGMPWKLIYYEGFLDKINALKEEKFLKTGRGRKRIKYILGEVA